MASKNEKDRAKQIQDRCQNILLQMLKDEDNKYCVDCDAKGPRWASWNLGIFLCIRCAGIHRNLGVHISKVKSVNLDSWTPEQVVSLQQMGNSRARAVYEANLPDSFRRPQTDSSLEAFIRAKYEQKKYIAKEWVPPAKLKVNWDKEIDEELEKQKRKKKSSSSSGVGPLPAPSVNDKKYNKSDVIPSIPKPKSSVSPKLGRNTPPTAVEQKSNGAADLLGLDTSKAEAKPSDDIFSSFFSAPQETPEPPKEETKPDLKTEEENFFKQPAPTEKEKSKLTKDSILALYSQTPATNFQSQPSSFQAPATNINNQFSQQNFSQFGSFQQQGFSNIPQNQQGFSNAQSQQGFSNAQQAQAFSNAQQAQAFSNAQQAQAFSNAQQAQAFSNVPQQNGMQFNQFQGNQFQQFGQPQQQSQQPFQQNFFNQQPQNVTQQFGSMSLGQSFPNTFPQNNVSNAWQ